MLGPGKRARIIAANTGRRTACASTFCTLRGYANPARYHMTKDSRKSGQSGYSNLVTQRRGHTGPVTLAEAAAISASDSQGCRRQGGIGWARGGIPAVA